jgi:hypothetical protein
MAVRNTLQKPDVDELPIAGGRLEFEAGVDCEGDVLDALAAIPEPELWLEAGEIGRIVRRYVAAAGTRGRFSAHSMRATFITRALENGASLEEVQRAAGHADASTTKLYDRRRFTPDKSAALFVSY